jgi:hypothetical protein
MNTKRGKELGVGPELDAVTATPADTHAAVTEPLAVPTWVR